MTTGIIGIDKIKFYNLSILEIDLAYLKEHNNVTIHKTPSSASLTVKDNHYFADLVLGKKYDKKGIPHIYTYLTLIISNQTQNNLFPLTYAEYSARIKFVLKYIKNEYHISLSDEDIKVKYVELNTNITLSDDYEKYNRALNLLMSLLNKNLKQASLHGKTDANPCETKKHENKSASVTMYDKTKELNDKNKNFDNITEQILRIEFGLKTGDKVKTALKTTSWKELNDNIFADYYITQIRKLEKRFDKWQQQRNKDLLLLIKECRLKSSKNWHHFLIEELQAKEIEDEVAYVLDIEQIYKAVKSIKEDRNAIRKCKSIANLSTKIDIYKNNDIDKVKEIFNAIERAYNNTISQ